MNVGLHIVRNADVWVTTRKAAAMMQKKIRWVQENKNLFKYERKGPRNLVFELSSIVKYIELNNKNAA